MLSLDKIERLAPDQGSLAAARKLLKPASWPTLASDGQGLIWGECQGSGATPYRIAVTEADAGYKCTCPSRKFPCKHALALMWMRADSMADFAAGSPPLPTGYPSMQTHQPTAHTKKTCKRRPFQERLKGFEPSTFCMAKQVPSLCRGAGSRLGPRAALSRSSRGRPVSHAL